MKLSFVPTAMLAVLIHTLSFSVCVYGQSPPAPPPAPASTATVPGSAANPGSFATPGSAPAAAVPGVAGAPPAPSVPPLVAAPSAITSPSSDQLKILELKNADAETTALQLRNLMPNAHLAIVPDVRTNQLIIKGWAEDCADATALVLKLDETKTKNPGAAAFRDQSSAGASASGKASPAVMLPPGFEIHTFHLSYANARDVYDSVMSAFKIALSKPGAGASWNLSEDKHINDLIVRADKDDLPRIDRLITQLDGSKFPKLALDAPYSSEEARKLLSNADSMAQQSQTAQQLYNDLVQKVQTLPADKQQQFQTALQQFQEIQRQLTDQTAAQAQLSEDMVRRSLEFRRLSEEQASRYKEDAKQLAKDQAWRQNLNSLANDIRRLTAKAGDNASDEQKAEIDDAKAKLKEVLSHQFDEQQKSESDELQQMRQRLDKLDKAISDRAQNRNDLIQHRLDELLSAANTTLAPNSFSMPVRITTPQLILKNVPGGGTANIEAGTPGIVTITQPSVNPREVTGVAKLNDGTLDASSVPSASGSVYEVHVNGPKAPKVGDLIQLKLIATNRGTVNTPILKIQNTTLDGLVPDNQKDAWIDIAVLSPGESKEVPMAFRVTRAGKINYSAKVQGEGVPATATYSAKATPADTAASPGDEN